MYVLYNWSQMNYLPRAKPHMKGPARVNKSFTFYQLSHTFCNRIISKQLSVFWNINMDQLKFNENKDTFGLQFTKTGYKTPYLKERYKTYTLLLFVI